MYKIETHLHTRPVSSCAFFEPEEMIRFYNEAGYSTVFVSDHFSKHHFDKLGEDLTWQEKTGLMYDSFLRAKAVGEELGMNVLFAPEFSFHGNHFLLYNVTPEFLNMRDDFFDMAADEFFSLAKENGITIIQAHPLRDGKTFFTMGGCVSSQKWKDEGLWYPQENPSAEEIKRGYENLRLNNNRVDYILTHKHRLEPADSLTLEGMINYIESEITYKHWYFGHWHESDYIDEKHTVVFDKLIKL